MNKLIFPTTQDIVSMNKFIRFEDNKINISRNIPYNPLDDKIEYIDELIKFVPKKEFIVNIAAYYLRNIIILQSFVEYNHRTAVYITIEFLKHGKFIIKDRYTNKDVITLKKRDVIYTKPIYEVYDYLYFDDLLLNSKILLKKDIMFSECLSFIDKNLIFR